MAASTVWQALGDVDVYLEPFAGLASVLLARPSTHERHIEKINDVDGIIVNLLRSIRYQPDKIIDQVIYPLSEVDIHACMAKIKYDVDPDMVSWLEGDPEHCDPKIAALTLVAASGSIGTIRSRGLWHVVDGHLRKTVSDDTGVSRSVPSCFGRGQGIYDSRVTSLLS